MSTGESLSLEPHRTARLPVDGQPEFADRGEVLEVLVQLPSRHPIAAGQGLQPGRVELRRAVVLARRHQPSAFRPRQIVGGRFPRLHLPRGCRSKKGLADKR
jgi:hypothetical protein